MNYRLIYFNSFPIHCKKTKMTLISIISFCVTLSIVRASDNVDTNNPKLRHCNYVNDSNVRILAATLVDGQYLFLIATIQKRGELEPSDRIIFQVTYVDEHPTHFFQSRYHGQRDFTVAPQPYQWTFNSYNSQGSQRGRHITYLAFVRI